MTASTRLLGATLLASAGLALGPVAAVPAQAAPLPANAVTDCLGAGKVWLVVDDHTGKTLHNQCVDKAATGQALLDAAGVRTTKDAKGFICQMDAEPAACPATFDGNFWQYYTAKQGGKWEFSQKGANDSVPAAGTLEGWCYGKQCTPTMPSFTGEVTSTAATPTPAAQAPAQQEAKKSPVGTILTLGLLALLAAAAAVVLRRRKA